MVFFLRAAACGLAAVNQRYYVCHAKPQAARERSFSAVDFLGMDTKKRSDRRDEVFEIILFRLRALCFFVIK